MKLKAKILITILTIAMTLSVLQISVNASEGELQGLINGGANTIKLDKDYAESVIIEAGKNITIDLNGHKITGKVGEDTITNKGTLTIIDSSAR